MGAGFFQPGGPMIVDARYRGPETGLDDDIFGPQTHDLKYPYEPGIWSGPAVEIPPQGQQQGHQQYYQQMRESMQTMDQVLKQLEGMQMPGGQYQARGRGDDPTGGFGGGGKGLVGKGIGY